MLSRENLLRSLLVALVISVSVSALAAAPEVQTIGPITATVPAAVKAALSETGYRVTADGAVAEIWPAKNALSGKNGSSSALYPDFPDGGFFGVINFPNGAGDFRGQKIPAGTYTLRYQLLPGDGNHMGVAPNPDFFLLVPAEADPGPTDKIPYNILVKLSAKASGAAHPAAFSLATAGPKCPGAANDEAGHLVATIPIRIGSATIPVGIIVKGSAEQ